MEALREKFRPETKTTRGRQSSDDDNAAELESESDYFSLKRRHGSGGTVGGGPLRTGSASSSVTAGPRTPAARTMGLAMESIKPKVVSSPTSFYTPIPSSSSLYNNVSSTPKSKPTLVKPSSIPSNLSASGGNILASSPNRSSQSFIRRSSTRRQVQAGDLLSMTNEDETSYRPSFFGPNTPKPISWGKEDRSSGNGLRSRAISTSRRINGVSSTQGNLRSNSITSSMTDFNLRDSVMSSLAKSIGLIQPPRPSTTTSSTSNSPFPLPSGSASMSSSPPLSAHRSAAFNSSFGPLSMLQRSMGGGATGGDDETSSMATGVSSGWGAANGDGQEELENEVEILFFPKGELIVREGEKNAGLFFVIDGFLEVGLSDPFTRGLARAGSCSISIPCSRFALTGINPTS